MPRNRDLPCAGCGGMMWRDKNSLPEGKARCHPCRREAWVTGTPDACRECAKPLTIKQRRAQGTYCSTACVLLAHPDAMDRVPDVGFKRKRRRGTMRPVFLPGDPDIGTETVLMAEPPPAHSILWLQGPCRPLIVTIREYDDGTRSVRCPHCYAGTTTDGASGWCTYCAVMVTVG